ncbi:MAG: methylmalonyl Co-A mutase-associated GTPase MeaB [Bacteroidales bacterium]|jgi:LAO/AO transport system kinase|nr:methylmalonyl Co-A mutase-associated GTPase MeaB [Bacteroidales bacterium]
MLIVQDGIPQPDSVNPDAVKNLKLKKKKQYTCDEYVEGILSGDRVMLGQAITLVESLLPEHNELAQQIIEKCLPYAGKSIRIGITGVPGAGKSTFIEALGTNLTAAGHRVAVLAIDPSSVRTKGSILGDKTRMEQLATDENAFIRPSPSAGTLGGVARKTHEIIFLCEAAGFDIVLIETVGVGQSEIAVHSMVDFFLLILIAGAGDELQGIKRGIMEMADAIVINKADGDNIEKSKLAAQSYANALRLFPISESGWKPQVHTCSSIDKSGVEDIWNMIEEYKSEQIKSGYFFKKRNKQSLDVMFYSVEEQLKLNFYNEPGIKELLPEIEELVVSGKMSSYIAAKKLIEENG